MEEEDKGIELDGVIYTAGDIQNLKAGHDANKDKKEKLAQLEKEHSDTTEKLKKFENKDYNFKKLRDMNEEEKGKLTATEMELKKKQEELEENQSTFTKQIIESNKNEALAVLVGDDKKIRDKVLYNYDRIKGEAVTKEDINNKMRDAFNMVGLSSNQVNSLNQAVNYSGGAPISTPKTKATSEQIDLAKKMGLTEDEIKKL